MDDGRSVHHWTRVLDRTPSLRFLNGSLDGATRVDSGCCRREEGGVYVAGMLQWLRILSRFLLFSSLGSPVARHEQQLLYRGGWLGRWDAISVFSFSFWLGLGLVRAFSPYSVRRALSFSPFSGQAVSPTLYSASAVRRECVCLSFGSPGSLSHCVWDEAAVFSPVDSVNSHVDLRNRCGSSLRF
mmetsp:Transcript_19922/g.36150  ORF Transcript_19922/g.36150 Transcript_19922/m.36150 type:complete len:185 (-) Transcript_19922:99-653(-)